MMTEDEWLACTDPEPMLHHLEGRATARKLRLYACAWGYDLWHRMTDHRSRVAVLTAERFADGLADPADLHAAFNDAQQAWKEIRLVLGGRHGKGVKSQDGSRAAKWAAEVARNAANPEWGVRMARRAAWRENSVRKYTLANHLRDIFGNPFRPAAVELPWLSWNDGTVPKLAQVIYDEGSFDQLPVVADALEDAGYTSADLLGHLRGPGPHVRGCWALDLVLGLE